MEIKVLMKLKKELPRKKNKSPMVSSAYEMKQNTHSFQCELLCVKYILFCFSRQKDFISTYPIADISFEHN